MKIFENSIAHKNIIYRLKAPVGYQQRSINKFTKNLIKQERQTIKFEREIEQFSRRLYSIVKTEYRLKNIDAYEWKSTR